MSEPISAYQVAWLRSFQDLKRSSHGADTMIARFLEMLGPRRSNARRALNHPVIVLRVYENGDLLVSTMSTLRARSPARLERKLGLFQTGKCFLVAQDGLDALLKRTKRDLRLASGTFFGNRTITFSNGRGWPVKTDMVHLINASSFRVPRAAVVRMPGLRGEVWCISHEAKDFLVPALFAQRDFPNPDNVSYA